MPRPHYRNRAALVEVGDFVAGWANAEGTEEVAGYVVSMAPEQAAGDNLTLAVLEYDPYPHGVEPPRGESDVKKGVTFKDHEDKAAVLNVRLVTVNSERLELKYRRTGLDGWMGTMRMPRPDVLKARQAEDDSRRRQTEAGSFVSPKGHEEAPPPITSRPPEPLPKKEEPPKPTPAPKK